MRHRAKAFTMAEVLVSLVIICLATVAIGKSLSSIVKIDKGRDISVAIKSQNISTVEYLRDSINSVDDIWKLNERYNCEILGYSAETTAEVLAVERGSIEFINKEFISSYSGTVAFAEGITAGEKSFGHGIEFNGTSTLEIGNGKLANYDRAVLGVAVNDGEIGTFSISCGSTMETIVLDSTSGDTTMTKLINLGGLSDKTIRIQNLSSTDIYLVNTYFILDSTIMGYEEQNNIVESLKDDIDSNIPRLFRVKVDTQILESDRLNKDIAESSANNAVVTYIMTKE